MTTTTLYALAADAILLLHVLFVLFVVLGLLFVFLGGLLSWDWARNPWFRLLHLLAIGVVVLQSWFGVICPLTVWEMKLRSYAGEAVYPGAFIAHWLERLLYYEAPVWVFAVYYSLFGGLVLLAWLLVRPHGFRRGR